MSKVLPGAVTPAGEGQVMLTMRGISKRFGDKVALENIDLTVNRAEVHAICGENGAGKSTLMNILSGIHQPDGGEIVLNGKPLVLPDASAATRLGIGMVHQHFTLVPSMTVAENIYLGRQPKRWGLFSDQAAMVRQAGELVERLGFHLDVEGKVADLTVGQRQRVEIVKALAFDAEVLILDEPTAVLTPPEVDDLIEIVAGLRARGRTVLFITHKLREVKELSDRVTVIRRGLSVGSHTTADITVEDIAQEMVGRSVFLAERRESTPSLGDAVATLEADHLTYRTDDGRTTLDDVSLAIRPGEILGIAGVEGNGQTELAEVLTGLRELASGTIRLAGRDVTAHGTTALRKAGVAHIPEDRLDRGLSKDMSVAENLAVSNYGRRKLVSRGLVSRSALRIWAQECIDAYDIRGARPETPVGQLSGGNMQKVVIARELAVQPQLIVVAQPTRGVDIGASEFVHHQILDAAASGAAVLLISSELTEILALSDRVGVMFRGRLVDVLPRAQATEQQIGLLMNTGSTEAAA